MKALGYSETKRLPYWLVPEIDLFSPLFLVVDVSDYWTRLGTTIYANHHSFFCVFQPLHVFLLGHFKYLSAEMFRPWVKRHKTL